jgi:hypothetical protein
MANATFRIWRGDASQSGFKDYNIEMPEDLAKLFEETK